MVLFAIHILSKINDEHQVCFEFHIPPINCLCLSDIYGFLSWCKKYWPLDHLNQPGTIDLSRLVDFLVSLHSQESYMNYMLCV